MKLPVNLACLTWKVGVYLLVIAILTITGIFLLKNYSNKQSALSETISFSSTSFTLEKPMAGIGAFLLNEIVYLLTYTDSTTIYKLTDSGLEKVIDGRNSGLTKRGSFNVEVLGEKAYIIGGSVDRKVTGCSAKVSTGAEYDCATNEVWIFDGKTITKSSPMLQKREVLASGVVDGKIYVIGGWFPNEQNNNEKSVEIFDGTSWKEISYSGIYYPVRSAAYATVGKKIYLFGGCLRTEEKNPVTFSCNSKLTQIFDTETNTFSQGTPMPIEGRHFSGQHAVVKGNYIYLFGGATALSDKIFDDLSIYDTQTDSWKSTNNKMTTKRKSVASVVAGDRLWIFGGISCDQTRGCPAEGGTKTATQTVEYGLFSPEN